jgi:hypothetical protein
MKHINASIKFVVFLEEFLLWRPGQVNTLIEKILAAIVRGLDGGQMINEFIIYVNPLLMYFLLLGSVGPVVWYLKSIFGENARVNLLVWLERNAYIRILLAVILGIVFIWQLLLIFDNPQLTFLMIYQNKTLWTVIFTYIIAKRFISDKAWGE